MMAAKGAIYPVHELMADAGETFDPSDYLPAVYGYYSTTDGKLLSMPFNSSTPVLYYNKDAFKKAGLDPNTPPKTWPDVERSRKKLLAAGYHAASPRQWPSWMQIENFGAWHNKPFATKANGFAGLDIKLRSTIRCASRTSRTSPSGRRTRSSTTAGARRQAEAEVHHRRMRDDHGLVRLAPAASRSA